MLSIGTSAQGDAADHGIRVSRIKSAAPETKPEAFRTVLHHAEKQRSGAMNKKRYFSAVAMFTHGVAA
jgi:hypothetical protein